MTMPSEEPKLRTRKSSTEIREKSHDQQQHRSKKDLTTKDQWKQSLSKEAAQLYEILDDKRSRQLFNDYILGLNLDETPLSFWLEIRWYQKSEQTKFLERAYRLKKKISQSPNST